MDDAWSRYLPLVSGEVEGVEGVEGISTDKAQTFRTFRTFRQPGVQRAQHG